MELSIELAGVTKAADWQDQEFTNSEQSYSALGNSEELLAKVVDLTALSQATT